MISLRRAFALVPSVRSRSQAVLGLPLLAGVLLCAAILTAPITPAAAQTVTLTSLTPATLTTASPTGGGTVTITITGSGFNPNGCSAMGTPAGAPAGTTYYCSYIELHNIPQGPSVKQIYIAPSASTTTVLSTQAIGTVTATQITATLSDTWFQHAGLVNVFVQNYGGSSQAASLPLTINNPAPVLTSVSPTSQRAATTSSLSLYVNGSSFTKDSVVLWNGVNLGVTQTPTSSTQLIATIPTGSLANPGNVSVSVYTPDTNNTGGGGTSAPAPFQITNPYPSPTALTPSSVPVGSPGFALTISGVSFVAGATVQFGNSTYTPSSVTPTSITVSIPASEPKLASSGNVSVSVTNPAPGGGTGTALTFTVVNPQPSVSSVSPTSASLNSPSTSITVTGQNFDPSTVVTWSGASLATTYVNINQLKATIPAADLTTFGTFTIGVTNVAFGTASTTTASFSVQNPVPGVSTLAPSSVTAGGTPPLVTITGTNFVSGSTVRWNGQSKTPTVVSATQLQVALTASDLAQSGTFQVLVSNPTPGGGTSAPLTFTVNNPQPTLSGLSLTSAVSGSSNTSFTVTGSNFVNGSQVTWNGATVSTSYLSGTELTATIPAANFATSTTAYIGVTNPTPGGGTSSTLPFAVVQPAAIQVGALQQSGAAVSVPVSWSGGTPTSGTFSCPQGAPTTITTLTGTCTYTTPGTYTISGSYVMAGQTYTPTSAPVTIPALALQPTPITPTVDGQSVTSLQVYSLPIPVTVPLTFTSASGIGIIDALDLRSSTVDVALGNGAPTHLTLTMQDPLTYSTSTSLTTAGNYTFTLNGKSLTGQSVTASTPFTLTLGTIALQLDPIAQQGQSVVVGVHWPATPAVTNQTVTCGTTPAQTFTGTDGQCAYSTPGTFPVVGTFTDPRNVPNVTTAAARAVIPALVPQPTPLVPTIGGQPASTAHVYSLPVPVDLPLTFTLPPGVGILDELDLTVSRVDASENGASPNHLSLSRIDGLHYDTGASLTDTANYAFTLVGQTKTGQPVTMTATLALTITPLSLQAGALAQQGPAVAVPIQWPTDPVVTDMVVDCGTTPAQTFTGASGQCVYPAPGTFTITGKFTDPGGTPNVPTAPLPVPIPSLGLTPIPLVPTIGGQPAASLAVYALPVTVTIPVTFTAAPGVGITDSLDLGASRLAVLEDGVQQARLPLQATDLLDYSVSTSVLTTGTYTFTLDGHTKAGSSVTATVTLPMALTPVPLQAGALVQQGTSVVVPVTWPTMSGLADQTVNCGIRNPVQTFTGPTGQCVYSQSGSFTVTGQFTDPNGDPNVAATPLTVTIPSVAPAISDFALVLNGDPATPGTPVATTLPAVLDVTVTLAPPQAVGILDPIFPATAAVTVALQTVKPITVPLTASADGFTLTGETLLEYAGAYHAAFVGRTQRNVPLSAAADMTLTGAPINLQLGALNQDSPQSISVPIAFPDGLLGSNFYINCGTPRDQVLTGTSVTCKYTAPGTYTPTGYYVPQGTSVRVPTMPAQLTIPGLLPVYMDLGVTFPGAGPFSETSESTPSARVYHLTPVTYPVDIKVAATPVTDPSTGPGIVQPFDRTSASITLQLLDPTTGQAVSVPATNGPGATSSTHTLTLPLYDDPTSNTFSVRTTMRGFDQGTGTPNISGQWLLTFKAKTTTGTPVTTTATLRIDNPLLQAFVIPYGIQGPYAPAQYRYRVTSVQSAVKHERLSLLWTVTDRAGDILRQVKNATTFAVTLTDPGSYHVTLTLAGSVSGTYDWSDDLLVPEAPSDPNTPIIQITSGGPQRPPVEYQLKAFPPALDSPDRYTFIEWFLDGKKLQHPANRAYITTPGAHTIQVTYHALKSDDRIASVTIDVRDNMSPRGTIDCSQSVPTATNALLRCSGIGLDPDGRITNRRWVIPELNLDVRSGWTLKTTVKTPPPAVTVHLYVTDDSGATQDLGPLTVPLQPTPDASSGS